MNLQNKLVFMYMNITNFLYGNIPQDLSGLLQYIILYIVIDQQEAILDLKSTLSCAILKMNYASYT